MTDPLVQHEKTMKGWHFLPADKRLKYDDRRHVRVGRTLRVADPLVLCKHGLHASKRLIDALSYSAGPVVCRVRLGGKILHSHSADKSVGTERTVEWMFDATNVLHRFACRVAEDALRTASVTDERCWNAIHTKRKWLRGEATDNELIAAECAARYAGYAVVKSAEYAAGAAAKSAEYVARADAVNAARSAARSATRTAGYAVNAADARAVAEAEQNRILTPMVMAEKRRKGATP